MGIRNPELSRGMNYKEKGAHENDNISVANIDYCGIISLIRGLLQWELCTAEEAKKSRRGSRYSSARTSY